MAAPTSRRMVLEYQRRGHNGQHRPPLLWVATPYTSRQNRRPPKLFRSPQRVLVDRLSQQSQSVHSTIEDPSLQW
jgi:hypothetical protein